MTLQPTATQVRQLLAPWRSPRLREAATSMWRHRFDEAIRLRTHYPAGGGDDDWRRVFDVFPELAGPVQGYARCGGFAGDWFEEPRARLREACAGLRGDGAAAAVVPGRAGQRGEVLADGARGRHVRAL